jgi:GATA-binding protein 4
MAAYVPFDYKHPESMPRMNELSTSPQLTSPTFTHLESYERTPTVETVRPYQHAMPVFNSAPYSSSSEESVNDLPPPAPLPKKPYRVPKQDKGIKCDHCGIDKTPLWRKVPHRDNAYHCNACGLYYKSNGHFRETEGETRVIRSKKPRKPGDMHLAQSFRAGPVTANRNLSCANCRTNTTVLWRKGPDGQSPLCNPCGLFYKLHGTHRSPEKKKEIHRRNRTGKKRYSICTEKSSSWSSAEEGDDEESPSSGEFGYRKPSVGGSPQQQQPQHPQQQQHLQQQQQQSFVKMEGREFAPSQGVSHLPSFMGQPQYPYQWQGQSVQGRC